MTLEEAIASGSFRTSDGQLWQRRPWDGRWETPLPCSGPGLTVDEDLLVQLLRARETD